MARRSHARDDEWLKACEELLARRRWLNGWEADFLESNLANENERTEKRELVAQRIRFDTKLVEAIDGLSVSHLITALHKCRAVLTDDEEEWIVALATDSCVRVAWRDAKRLLHLANRWVV